MRMVRLLVLSLLQVMPHSLIVLKQKTSEHAVNSRNRTWRINWKTIQWHPQTPIEAVAEIASSVSHLASKFHLRRQRESSGNTSKDREDCVTDTKHSIEKPVRLVSLCLMLHGL